MQTEVDPLATTLEELRKDPGLFRETGGYQRVLALVQSGCSVDAVKKSLRGQEDFVGDLLWTVCELENVEPFVDEAILHLRSADVGTSAYATEVVLRGAKEGRALRECVYSLLSAPPQVLEHAAIVLAGQGLRRAREVFHLGGLNWAAALLDTLVDGIDDIEPILVPLVTDGSTERVLVGLVLAALASEQDEAPVQALERVGIPMIAGFARRLRLMYAHRWKKVKGTVVSLGSDDRPKTDSS